MSTKSLGPFGGGASVARRRSVHGAHHESAKEHQDVMLLRLDENVVLLL